MNSLIVGVAIGLVFLFALFAALTSMLTEAVARFLGLRGAFLLRGIRALVDGQTSGMPQVSALGRIWALGPAGGGAAEAVPPPVGAADTTAAGGPPPPLTDRLLANALLASQGQQALLPSDTTRLSLRERRRLPAYLPARTFARAVIAFLAPDARETTTLDELRKAVDRLGGDGVLRKSLQVLLANAGDSLEAFRESVEQWYDDHMDRVSGWYKRHVRWISLTIGALLVLAFNANVVAMTRALYADESLRESVVTQAVAAADCGGRDPADCLREVRGEIEELRTVGLPLGWPADPLCEQAAGTAEAGDDCSFFERFGLADRAGNGLADARYLLVLLVGYTLMVLALVPGARFWFDLLGRLGSLRSSGPKPARS
jgi:hypothetical protein